MLLTENRLKKKTDFQKVLAAGVPFSFDNAILKVRKNALNKTRIGFLIGRSATRSAVRRNRIKRVLRAAFSKFVNRMKQGHDIVVVIHAQGAGKRPFQFSDKQTEEMLKKSKLLKS